MLLRYDAIDSPFGGGPVRFSLRSSQSYPMMHNAWWAVKDWWWKSCDAVVEVSERARNMPAPALALTGVTVGMVLTGVAVMAAMAVAPEPTAVELATPTTRSTITGAGVISGRDPDPERASEYCAGALDELNTLISRQGNRFDSAGQDMRTRVARLAQTAGVNCDPASAAQAQELSAQWAP